VIATGSGRAATPAPEAGRGWAQRLQAIDAGRFGRAFWLGVRLALYAFAVLAAYVLLRSVARRLRRLLSARLDDTSAHRR
jgi:hypothetical protein